MSFMAWKWRRRIWRWSFIKKYGKDLPLKTNEDDGDGKVVTNTASDVKEIVSLEEVRSRIKPTETIET